MNCMRYEDIKKGRRYLYVCLERGRRPRYYEADVLDVMMSCIFINKLYGTGRERKMFMEEYGSPDGWIMRNLI